MRRFTAGTRLPRPGDLLTEYELGDYARALLERGGVSQKEAAEVIGVKQTELSMSLSPANYPGRGETRRKIIRHYAELDVGPARFPLQPRAPDDVDPYS